MLRQAIHFALVGSLFFTSFITLANEGVITESLTFRDIQPVNSATNKQQGAVSTEQLLNSFRRQFGQSFEFKVDDHGIIESRREKSKAQHTQLSHQRFNQYYQGYPIWDHQIAVHTNELGQVVKLNGHAVKSIDEPLYVDGLTAPKHDKSQVIEKAVALLKSRNGNVDVEFSQAQVMPYVFIDKDKARLVYHLHAYYHFDKRPFAPHLLIDANTLEMVKIWDGIMYQDATAKGPGGNEKIGRYVYGEDKPFLDVSAKGEICYLENEQVKTLHLQDSTYGDKAHQFSCPENNEQAENGAFSPLNDAHFHATKAVDMFNQWLGIALSNEKINVRVHDGSTYAYAYDSTVHVGKGDEFRFPGSTVNTIGHEMAHVFISQGSYFHNYGQMGAVNESFADITGEALEYFIDGQVDWFVDAHIYKADKPLRYFQDPSLDGKSIGHFANYRFELGTHESAGLFNRAFYLLATSQNWDVQKAFSAFVDAKRFYWVIGNSFAQAACGVIQAADDRGLNAADVDNAFMAVGISCTNLPTTDNDNDGMSDVWELRYGFSPNNAYDRVGDYDGDGLLNHEEYANGTSPKKADSDGDGLSDSDEVKVYFTDATDWDTDGDVTEDGFEINNGTNPLVRSTDRDTDEDGVNDLVEVFSGSDFNSAASKPVVIEQASQLFEQEKPFSPQKLGTGWYIDVRNEANNSHLWQFKTGGASQGQQYLAVELDNDDGESELSWYGDFPSGHLVYDYLYHGEQVSLNYTSWYRSKEVALAAQNQWHRQTEKIADGGFYIKWKVTNSGTLGQFAIDNVHFFADGIDQDGDGMEDYWEHMHALDFTDSSDGALDSDQDGLTNRQEALLGTNPLQVDSDGDGYSDYAEVHLHQTNPNNADGDSDGMDDKWEVKFGLNPNLDDANDDLDNDGYTNLAEYHSGTEPNNPNSVITGGSHFLYDFEIQVPDGFVLDSSPIPWQWEQQENGNYVLRAGDADVRNSSVLTWQGFTHQGSLIFDLFADFNGDSSWVSNLMQIFVDGELHTVFAGDRDEKFVIELSKGWHTVALQFNRYAIDQNKRDEIYLDNWAFFATSLDDDGDGLLDLWEHQHGLDYTDANDANADADDDGLSNKLEYQWQTQVRKADSDGDGLTDGQEVLQYNTNPLHTDTDGDYAKDAWEVRYNLDPLSSNTGVDTDGDGFDDITEHRDRTNPQDPQSYPKSLSSSYYDFNDGTLPAEFIVDSSTGGSWQVDSNNGYLQALASVGQAASLLITGLDDYRYIIFDYKLDLTNGNLVNVNSSGLRGVTGWRRARHYIYGNTVSFDFEPIVDIGQQDIVYIDNILFASNDSDFDGDGIPDVWEVEKDLNPFDGADGAIDADSDGLTNVQEYQNDTDILKSDTDGDGISDGDEVNVYQTNPKRTDSDFDGLSDSEEIRLGLNPNTNNKTTDSDSDGLSDEAEYYLETDVNDANSYPQNRDYIKLDFNDGQMPRVLQIHHISQVELAADSDNPSNLRLTNNLEYEDSSDTITMKWYGLFAKGSVFFDLETSEDGAVYADAHWQNVRRLYVTDNELTRHKLEFNEGSDGFDYIDFSVSVKRNAAKNERHFWLDNLTFIADGRDGDNDGMEDSWEYQYYLDINSDDSGIDSDNDGLTNLQEFQNGSNPLKADSDGDGLSDYLEVTQYLSSPANHDSDGDELSDGLEVEIGTDLLVSELDKDSDRDLYRDTVEIESGSNWNDPQSIPPYFQHIDFDFENGLLPEAMYRYNWGNNADSHYWQVSEGAGVDGSIGMVYKAGGDGKVFYLTISGRFPAGTLSFDWKTGNEFGDRLEFTTYRDGLFSRTAYGSWTNESITYENGGTYEFTWIAQNTELEDAEHILAYVDNIRFIAKDLDSDSDGMPDHWEFAYGLDVQNSEDAVQDADGDLLTNLAEYQNQTNPNAFDSDGDLLSDYSELNAHSSSALESDSDNDGLFDHTEIHYGLDPNQGQSTNDIDGDGVDNVTETHLFTSPIDATSVANSVAIAEQSFEDAGSLIHFTQVSDGAGWQRQTSVNSALVSATLNKPNTNAQLMWHGKFGQGTLYFDYHIDAGLTDTFKLEFNSELLISQKGPKQWLRAKAPIRGGRSLANISWSIGRNESDKNGQNSQQVKIQLDNIVFISNQSDNDSDGLPDNWEYENGLSFNDATDALLDYDSDGLTNIQEYQAGTNIYDADTDNDGQSDGYEIENDLDPHDYTDGHKDSDGDGLSDEQEREIGTDANNPDTDGDGVNDKTDAFPLDPLESEDKDNNGLGDVYQNDFDYDGMDNDFERQYGLDLYGDDSQLDLDNDGMTNWQEFYYQFEPNNPADANEDADKDGHSNLKEVLAGANPRDARSYPGNFGGWFHLLLRDGETP